MTLQEFLLTADPDNSVALAAWQELPVVTGKMISPDMMLAFLTSFDLVDILDTVAENASTPVTKEAKGLRKAFSFGSEFNLITGHPASQISLLLQLETDNVIPQAFVDYCIAYANPESFPNAGAVLEDVVDANDVGETITLQSNTGQHKVSNITIATAPRKLTKLTIQHRFGNDAANLTEWHDVASVSVLYKQSTYSSGMIPASGSLIRELRLISPLSLGVGV
jgi:hypothetical protein